MANNPGVNITNTNGSGSMSGSMGPPITGSTAIGTSQGDKIKVENGSPAGSIMDEFEQGFLSCFGPLVDLECQPQESDEVRMGAQQMTQRFLDAAKAMEAFFLQKRLLLSLQRPELIVKEDVAELRNELARKETLIQKHYEKLQSWQEILNNLQQGGLQSAPPTQQQTQQQQSTQQSATTVISASPATPQNQTPSTPVRHQTPTQIQPPPQIHAMTSPHGGPHHMHQLQQAPQFPIQHHTAMSQQSAETMGMMQPGGVQGPLAKLERSTANIGMPDGWQ